MYVCVFLSEPISSLYSIIALELNGICRDQENESYGEDIKTYLKSQLMFSTI